MRTLKGFLYLILGGTLCGWMFNRIAAWFIDNPLTVGSNHTVAEWAVILQDPFYLDSRTMPFFFLAFGAIALVAMTKYDWTGEREEQKKLRGEEYGNQRWARDDEMQQFAHTSTVKRVPIRIPQRSADAMRFARNNPKDFIKAKLGMTNKVANPKPDYVEKIEDDNIILSERAELQMSKIPDPALERNKHVYVLGGSGSGKTFNFVGPNLLQLNSSIVTTDPKGDTLKQYGNFFLRHGYKLKVVNTKPDQINQSMHYNPLLYLQDSTSIMQIVNLLVENTSGNAEAEKEDFFVKAERQLYMALMGYLFYFYADQPQYQTFSQMLDLLQLAGKDNPSQTKTPLDIIMLGTTAEDGFQGFEEWIVANHGGDEAAAQASEEYFVIKQYKGFKSTSGSPETEASVIASCNVRLAPFAVSAVREFFSEDELELEMIGEERTAFFLVMSDTDKTFNFILAMLLYQLFDVNTAIADRNPGSHCKIPINCILDELANIGRIPDLDVKIATLRSRWIKFDAATGLVYVPKKYTVKNKAGEYKVASSRIQLLYATPDKGAANTFPVRVEAENVDGRAAKSGTASVDVSSPDTQIALARDKAARKSISDATIESVTVNGIEYTRDLDMWTYDKDTGTLDILIAAAGVRSVDIKLANDAEKNVGSWLASLATEAFAGNVWNIGTWEFQSAPWAGMSFHTAGHNKYTGARTGATLPAVENPSGGRYEAKTIYQALGTQNVDVSALQS